MCSIDLPRLPTSKVWVRASWHCVGGVRSCPTTVEAIIAETVAVAERPPPTPRMVMPRCRGGRKQPVTGPRVKPGRWCRLHVCCTTFPKHAVRRTGACSGLPSRGVGQGVRQPTCAGPPGNRGTPCRSCPELVFPRVRCRLSPVGSIADADGHMPPTSGPTTAA